ncbi:hypothetical protein CO675_30770 [Bradyrhizobium sp. C9]|nr:hypothetical protein CO675_30770 [Bradyrhizobium sp. C9]
MLETRCFGPVAQQSYLGHASVTITAAGKAAFEEMAGIARVIEDDSLGPLAATERRLLSQAIAGLEVVSARIEAAGWHALRERNSLMTQVVLIRASSF